MTETTPTEMDLAGEASANLVDRIAEFLMTRPLDGPADADIAAAIAAFPSASSDELMDAVGYVIYLIRIGKRVSVTKH